MALQIWLPLNKEGDFLNKGLADITVKGSPEYDLNGKIGGCYKNYSGKYLTISHNISDTTEFSFTYWINIPSTITLAKAWQLFMTFSGKSNDVLSNAVVDWTDYNLLKLYSSTGWDWKLWQSFSYDTWYHISVVHTSGNFKIYINGELESRNYNTSSILKLTAGNIIIGSGLNSTYSKVKFNDFRVYDHCLSPKEVKEISKGLVLHYPLNLTTYDGSNLITSLLAGGLTTVNNTLGTVTTSGVDRDTYFRLKISEASVDGQTYTIECYAENIPEDKYWTFCIGQQSNTNLSFKIHNGYNSYTFVASRAPNANLTWSTTILLDDIKRNYVWQNKAVFSNWKLYKHNKVSDCSGYCNNGTITGNLTTSNNTPRYDKCIYIGTNKITTPNLGLTAPYTLSYWQKATSTENFTQNYYILKWGDMFIYRDHNNKYEYSLLSSGKVISDKDKDNWNNIVVTDDGTIIKCYKNGQLVCSRTHTTNIGIITLGPGYNDFNASDFRIYSTALSDEDIKELYNTSVLIDNQLNLSAYSFNETSENNISKSGILNSNLFIEDSNVEIYEDKTKANQIIEI